MIKNKLKSHHIKTYWISKLIILLVIALDQTSKYLILKNIQPGTSHIINSWLNLTVQFNSGTAFSFFSGGKVWQIYLLALIAMIVCVGLILWLMQRPHFNSWQVIAVSLIVGGAIGNLIDRLRLRHVIDFIDFHIGDWHYATFNLADSFITIGVAILIFSLLVTSTQKEHAHKYR